MKRILKIQTAQPMTQMIFQTEPIASANWLPPVDGEKEPAGDPRPVDGSRGFPGVLIVWWI